MYMYMQICIYIYGILASTATQFFGSSGCRIEGPRSPFCPGQTGAGKSYSMVGYGANKAMTGVEPNVLLMIDILHDFLFVYMYDTTRISPFLVNQAFVRSFRITSSTAGTWLRNLSFLTSVSQR